MATADEPTCVTNQDMYAKMEAMEHKFTGMIVNNEKAGNETSLKVESTLKLTREIQMLVVEFRENLKLMREELTSLTATVERFDRVMS